MISIDLAISTEKKPELGQVVGAQITEGTIWDQVWRAPFVDYSEIVWIFLINLRSRYLDEYFLHIWTI